MTESIQKKLLRVRAPRVRITYDVETGGAIEKKELPFIVGILADLKGDRDAEPPYDPLKLRKMIDIDRDNFNDVMRTIQPQVNLKPDAKNLLPITLGMNAIRFSTIEDFEPLKVVKALPGLKCLYISRCQIRSLQAKAEGADDFAKLLAVLLQADNDSPPNIDLVAQKQNLLNYAVAFSALEGTDNPKKRVRAKMLVVDLKKAIVSQVDVDHNLKTLGVADDPSAKSELSKILDAIDVSKLEQSVDTPAGDLVIDQLWSMPLLLSALLKDPNPSVTPTPKELLQFAKDNPTPSPVNTAKAILALKCYIAQITEVLQAPTVPELVKPAIPASPTEPVKPVEPIAPTQPVAPVEPVAPAADAATEVKEKYTKDKADYDTAKATYDISAADYLKLKTTYDTDSATYTQSISAYAQLKADYDIKLKAYTDLKATYDISKSDYDASQNKYDISKNTFDANVKRIRRASTKGTISVMDELVTLIDVHLSKTLSTIMHLDSFKKMEATWRGLQHFVFNTETNNMLKLRVFNAQKEELLENMQKAVEFDQSVLFKMVYEAEYGTYGGFPYSLLVGDYAIGCSGDDIDFLGKMAEVAAAAHAPFLAQASEKLFRLTGLDKLDKPRDLAKIFESQDLIGWRAFRELEDARYVTLALPRALLRLPYGMPEKRNTKLSEGLNFNEQISDVPGEHENEEGDKKRYAPPNTNHFLWGNPAYLLAERITNAFSLYNWTAAIRGVEGGGLVEGLPTYTYTSEKGHTELFCPIEVAITDRREKELNDLGFISLCHCKGTGKAAFFGGQTTNLPKKYFSDDANANAKISAMLPYMLAASRFAHYIKVIMREKIGSFLTRANVESYLNTWISNYVLLDDNATQEVKSAYPLRSARVVVTDVPGEPGAYRATVFLKPHFQLEELTTSIRLVANLPK
ncbi:type VI secretion system contractile sheath large subunit [Undibacterium sp. Xuan67W]|uniref:type VI secretion system contractile sheath large subunit n=1 Tax=Undibacterium sp. Xuan67W TaxID=3413057 RepID=UPI003BF33589